MEQGNYTTDKVDWLFYNLKIDWKNQATICAKELIRIRDELNYNVSRNQFKDIMSGETSILKAPEGGELFTQEEARYGVEMAYNETGAEDGDEKALYYEMLLLSDKYLHDMVYKATGKDLVEYDVKPIVDGKNKKREDKAIKMLEFIIINCPYMGKDTISDELRSLGFSSDEVGKALRARPVNTVRQALRYAKFIYVTDGHNRTDAEIASNLSIAGFTDVDVKYAIQHMKESANDDSVEIYDDASAIKALKEAGFNDLRANILLENLKMYMQSSEPLQIQETKAFSSENTVTTGNLGLTGIKVEINEKISQYLAEKPWSKKSISTQLELKDGYSYDDVVYVVSRLNKDWTEEAIRMATDLFNSGKNNKLMLEDELVREGFLTNEIEAALKSVGLS